VKLGFDIVVILTDSGTFGKGKEKPTVVGGRNYKNIFFKMMLIHSKTRLTQNLYLTIIKEYG
jgi:hypothetical protein